MNSLIELTIVLTQNLRLNIIWVVKAKEKMVMIYIPSTKSQFQNLILILLVLMIKKTLISMKN